MIQEGELNYSRRLIEGFMGSYLCDEMLYDVGLSAFQNCLLNFSTEEAMTGDSRWNCPRCRVKRDAVKRIVIWKLPRIAIIVLKR